jgi:hypothetical protein
MLIMEDGRRELGGFSRRKDIGSDRDRKETGKLVTDILFFFESVHLDM